MNRRLLWLVGVLGVANAVARGAYRAGEGKTAKPTVRLPLALGEWKGREVTHGWKGAAGIGADWMLQRWYDSATGGTIELLMVYDVAGRHSHYSPETCLQNAGWEFLWKRKGAVKGPEGRAPVTEALIEKEGRRRAVVYWYQLGSRRFTSRVAREVALVKQAIVPGASGGGLNVRIIAAASDGDESQSRAMALEFCAMVLGVLEAQMGGRG